jgi:hypothetical protein
MFCEFYFHLRGSLLLMASPCQSAVETLSQKFVILREEKILPLQLSCGKGMCGTKNILCELSPNGKTFAGMLKHKFCERILSFKVSFRIFLLFSRI